MRRFFSGKFANYSPFDRHIVCKKQIVKKIKHNAFLKHIKNNHRFQTP